MDGRRRGAIWRGMRQLSRLLAAGLCAALPVSAAAAPACTAQALSAFAGSWDARGSLRREPAAAAEPVRCRIAFAPDAAGRLISSGRCATRQEAREVTGWLACRDGGWAGNLLQLGGGETPGFLREVAAGPEIGLLLQVPHPETGAPERYRALVTPPTDTSMRLRLVRDAWEPLTLRLTRR
jgi:hypothetical protein